MLELVTFGQHLAEQNAAIELDFNSIAAGHAVDLIAQRLRAMGIDNFLAEATGELKAVGRKPDGSAWRQGWDFAIAHGIAAVLVTRVEGGFVSRSTPAFERRVKGE
ncbi:hypothetical protein WR25_10905 [Diploscapter pachys]|uniref:FAD:protein FMN transferase n=1 Tax=Diploscapter pachys TaxID=2018661 RepID=A0A2A2KDQ2_9BILA|nr:hypothetical protein WR25_10905 [Diploscapter pachys]